MFPEQAQAVCANPSAPEGRLIYNSTSKVVQFCDGTNWIGMGGGGGGGGSSSLVGLSDVDAASAGTGNALIYNAVSGKWEAAAVGSDTQVIFNDGGALSGNAGFVFDKTNVRVGVGTATPAEAVDVAGLVTSQGVLLKSVAGDPPTLASAPNLGNLADVDTSSQADGLILKYNGTSSKWEAASGGTSSQWTTTGSNIYYSGGNVGIGTTSPNALLDVAGTGRVYSSNWGGQLSFGSGTQWYLAATGTSTATAAFGINGWDGSAYQNRLNILSNGNVGIGTTSPTENLDVVGKMTIHPSGTNPDNAYQGNLIVTKPVASGQYINLIRSGSYPWSIGMVYNSSNFAIGTGQATDSNFTNPQFVVSGSGDLVITGSTAYKAGGGSWTASSDARLKDVDGTYDSGLENIVRLNPVRFHYKKNNPRNEPSGKEFIGLIAQEAMEVMPELVSLRDDGYYDLDPSALSFALINAIKELEADNDNLRTVLKAANDNNAAAIRALREELSALRASRQ